MTRALTGQMGHSVCQEVAGREATICHSFSGSCRLGALKLRFRLRPAVGQLTALRRRLVFSCHARQAFHREPTQEAARGGRQVAGQLA